MSLRRLVAVPTTCVDSDFMKSALMSSPYLEAPKFVSGCERPRRAASYSRSRLCSRQACTEWVKILRDGLQSSLGEDGTHFLPFVQLADAQRSVAKAVRAGHGARMNLTTLNHSSQGKFWSDRRICQ